LFNFDVHDDVRLLADATVEKDESHAGKVVTRSYYARNKHIFPASRWEVSNSLDCLYLHFLVFYIDCTTQVYDPEKAYGKYTIA
jgi:protein FAM50